MKNGANGFDDPKPDPLLSKALSHIQEGAFASAEEILSDILAERPEDAGALHVLGQLRRIENKLPEAEEFFRRAIAAAPSRPELHFHLGQTLALLGRTDEAIATFRDTIRLKPDLPEAHFELGMAYSRKLDFAAAETAYREALRLEPRFLAARHALSMTYINLSRPKEAEAVARSSLQPAGGDMRWYVGFKHAVALALAEQHRYDEAVHAFDQVLSLTPAAPQAEYDRANALQSLGRIEDAETAYRRALARDPLDFMAHRGLNQLLWRRGRSDVLESYDNAAKIRPNSPILFVEKGMQLLFHERPEDAREAFERALAMAPDDERAHEGHASALARLGRFGEAVAEFEAVIVRRPKSVEIRCGLVECLLRASESEKALRAAEEARALAPHHQTALALWSTAMRQQGETAETALNDYDKFVQTFDLGPPEGFGDLGTFHDVVTTFLDRLHGEKPSEGATGERLVSRTSGSLLGDGSEVMTSFCAHLDKAVGSYVMRLADDETHPFLNRRQGALRYARSWSTRVWPGGAIPNHVHENSWISAIYFIKLPDDVTDRTNARGWTKFGEPPFDAHLPGPAWRALRPLPGRLVLFPSYLWHGSIAFRAPQPRLSIAFDLVPEASRAAAPANENGAG